MTKNAPVWVRFWFWETVEHREVCFQHTKRKFYGRRAQPVVGIDTVHGAYLSQSKFFSIRWKE